MEHLLSGFDLSIPEPIDVMSEAEAKKWIARYLETHRANGGLGIDSETTGLVKHKDIVLYWSLSDGETRLCMPASLIPVFKAPILENPEIDFDFTNAKFDAHMFANSGADLSKAGEWRDTSQQSWCINENNSGRHGLKECTEDHLGRRSPTFPDVFGKTPVRRKGMPEVTTADLIHAVFNDPEKRERGVDYASLDAYNSTKLRAHFDKMMEEVELYPGMTLKKYYYQFDVPFTKVLWEMERRGITVDLGHLKEQQGPMEADMTRIKKEFAREAGRVMNLSSSAKDPKWFFFEVLKKPVIKMTDGGSTGVKQPSLDDDVLSEWSGQGDKFAKLLQDYRGIEKTYGTYIKGLQGHLDRSYRIHTKFNQHGAVTGRLSSSEPNLQNIPRSGPDDPYKLREAFLAGYRKILLVADYEQLEMRLTAHFSQDQKMIHAILNGIDLHCLTVAEMYGIPYDEVLQAKEAKECKEKLTERQKFLLVLRQAAKATGFGIIYGIGGAGLAAQLTQTLGRVYDPQEGKDLIEKWFGVFPGVKRCKERAEQQIWQQGYVQTITGRFRRFGDLRAMSGGDRAQAERQALNSIVQGSAADIAKCAMLKCKNDPLLIDLGVAMLLQVHDELVFEADDNEDIWKPAQKRIGELMSDPFGQPLLVPIPAAAGVGYTWADAK